MSVYRQGAGAGLVRRLGRITASLAPPSPLSIMGGPYIYLEQSGITEASGVVASWDSIGSNTARFENALAGERPAVVTVGSRVCAQFDGSDDALFSAVNLQLVKRAVISIVLRADTYVVNRHILNPNNGLGALLSYGASTVPTDTFRWENGATDVFGTTAVVNGTWYAVVLDVDSNAGNVVMYINGVAEATVAGIASAPTSQVWSIAATPTGANSAAVTIADMAVWNSQASPDLDPVHTWNDYVLSQVGA